MNDADLDRLITGLAAAMELPVDPAHREGICTNLRRLLAQADIVMTVPMPPEAGPAAIFRP